LLKKLSVFAQRDVSHGLGVRSQESALWLTPRYAIDYAQWPEEELEEEKNRLESGQVIGKW